MDSSISPKDETWFLRVCHHISNAVYTLAFVLQQSKMKENVSEGSWEVLGTNNSCCQLGGLFACFRSLSAEISGASNRPLVSTHVWQVAEQRVSRQNPPLCRDMVGVGWRTKPKVRYRVLNNPRFMFRWPCISIQPCKWNQLGAQHSQYISSILFITSTCFGPLQVHHQEE